MRNPANIVRHGEEYKLNKLKKAWIMLNLFVRRDGFQRANYLKRKGIFGYIGENVYYHPVKIPSEPQLVELYDNVQVTANVTFITHDIIGGMLNAMENVNLYKVKFGTIKVKENCSIGSGTIILPDVEIGPRVIVASGSVVTQSFAPEDEKTDLVIGGNPAKVINDSWEKIRRKRKG